MLLVDYSRRLFRDRKALISVEISGILQRLGSSASAREPGWKNGKQAA
jgi:hypothetical protein